MLTTKRQIKRDSDRYGYYGHDDNGGIPLISDYEGIVNLDPIATERNVGSSLLMSDSAGIIPPPPAVADGQPQYTTLQTAEVARPAVMPRPTEVPERPAKAVTHEKEDILPTVKTRAYASGKAEIEEQAVEQKAPARRVHKAMAVRTKVMLCIYIVVALALAVAVIMTGVSLSHATAQADRVAVQIAQKQAVIAEQEKTLAVLQDADAIRGKAVANGMVSAGEPSYTVSPVEDVDYPEAEPRTDGFDKFIDWVSGILS